MFFYIKNMVLYYKWIIVKHDLMIMLFGFHFDLQVG